MIQNLLDKIEQTIKIHVNKITESTESDKYFCYINFSNRRDLGQLQSNIAFILAKKLKNNPIDIANKLKTSLLNERIFKEISVTEPGFVNFTLENTCLGETLNRVLKSQQIELPVKHNSNKIIMDYGGVNIAKSMHVGHLRSSVIGESLKRIFKLLGDEVISDIHLGDWGLPIGMLIEELKEQSHLKKYLHNDQEDMSDLPISIEDLERLYPIAAIKCKDDPTKREQARLTTKELQQGNKKYLSLWRKFLDISVIDIKRQFDFLDVHFDLWLGESSVNDIIPNMLENFYETKISRKSDDAIIIEVKDDTDNSPMPPVMLLTKDETITYAMTDIATIYQRIKSYEPDKIIYIVDRRQDLHFKQVFRAAKISNIIDNLDKLEYLGFGTINGLDNKPFKTRDGSAMRLSDLIDLVRDKARKKIQEENIAKDLSCIEQENIIDMIAIATIKFSDLSHEFKDNYIFDIDKFINFQGKTGPYILYSAVRIKSIIRKAKEQNIDEGEIILKNDFETELALKIIQFPHILFTVYKNRSLHLLCDYVHSLSQIFNSFYQNCPIIKENDRLIMKSRLSLTKVTLYYIENILYLLGIKIPEYM